MKKVTIFLLTLIISFCTIIHSYSISIDGYDDGKEWNDTDSQIIFNGESNCKVNFGMMKWCFEESTNTVYFCFMFKEPNLSIDNTNVGVSLQIDNSSPFIITAASAPNEIDVEKYFFDGIVKVNDNSGVTAEIRLGIKHGLPQVLNGKIRFYDSEGTPSNVFDFTIENTEYTADYGNNNSGAGYSPPNNATTKSVTVKSTTKPAEKTTQHKKTEKSDDDWYLFDLLFSEETTNSVTANTKKVKDTNSKSSTTKSKTKKYDKSEITTSDKTTEQTVEAVDISEEVTSPYKEDDITLAKGDVYKTITMVAGGISLVAISVLGTIKARKDDNNTNDPKS